MKERFDVDIHLSSSAPAVLSKIRSATEREGLPFISASRWPQQTEKGFVSAISGNRFRIWKVPSSSKSRQNLCYPYLYGTVRDCESGSNLTGSFALHPFTKVMVLLPLLAIAAPLWLWIEMSTKTLVLSIAVTAICLFVALAMAGGVKRLRALEEEDIVGFLFGLFPDARSPSTKKL